MISKKMNDAINAQINWEFWSAYLYLSMANNFEAQGRKGIANWFRVQWQEEMAHAQVFINYLNSRDGRVILAPIAEVPSEWATPLDAFKATLEHEQKVTSLINELYSLAEEEKDFATRQMLNWFVAEQVEEEDTARELIDNFTLIGDNGYGIYQLDRDLASRTYTEPSALSEE